MSASPDCSAPIRAGADERAEDAFTSEGGHVVAGGQPASVPSDVDEQSAQSTAALGIRHDGRYVYESHHDDRLGDAVAYARLRRLHVR